MSARTVDAFPQHDDEVRAFVAELGLPGIVDVHVHALPEPLQAAVWRFFDRLDDPPWPIHYRLPAEEQRAALRDIGVVARTALAYAHRPGMVEWLNDHTLGLATQHPDVIPTFTIFPEDGATEATAAAIDRGGTVVKVHVQVGRFHLDDPRLDDSWQMIATHRLPVVLHATAVYGVDGGAEYCGIDAVRSLLDRHPGLVVVIAHLGMPDYDDALELIEDTDDVYLDTAMTLHDGAMSAPVPADVAERLSRRPERILFGSDYPSIPHDYATQIRALARLGLDDAGLRAVLHDTTAGLLDRVSR